MTEMAALAKKLRIEADTTVRLWPDAGSAPAALQSLAVPDAASRAITDEDVALLVAEDRAALDQALQTQLAELAPLRAVWLIYPKANRTDFNRDTMWDLLLEHDWRTVAQVAVDDIYSAVRIRPLKPGETVRTLLQ